MTPGVVQESTALMPVMGVPAELVMAMVSWLHSLGSMAWLPLPMVTATAPLPAGTLVRVSTTSLPVPPT